MYEATTAPLVESVLQGRADGEFREGTRSAVKDHALKTKRMEEQADHDSLELETQELRLATALGAPTTEGSTRYEATRVAHASMVVERRAPGVCGRAALVAWAIWVTCMMVPGVVTVRCVMTRMSTAEETTAVVVR